MSFSDKQKLLFDSLNAAEKNISGSLTQQIPVPEVAEYSSRSVSNNTNTKKFRGKNSIFKRPEAPIGKCLKPKKSPGFRANPQKWTKYSLEDVDTSDRTNSSAAFAFLSEIEKRKSGLSDSDRITDISVIKKPSFNKTRALKSKLADADDDAVAGEKAQIKGSKVIMPEYVIGQKASKPKKIKTSSSKPDKKELKLDHLMEEEEDDDE